MNPRTNLCIDGQRLAQRLDQLAAIGRLEDGSCCRLALTDADRMGRDLVAGWMRELGLEVRVDRVGNLFGLRQGREELPPVMTGSHIDTVATGGRLDGNLGVLAGLEVIRTLDEAGVTTRHPLAVAVFMNEEGVRFQPDMMGSLVHAGGLSVEAAHAATGIDGANLGAELRRIGYAGDLEPGAIVPKAFVELHIEQGPILDEAGESLAAVSHLQGISWQEVTIRGVSNHAGTTPMRLRRDAGAAAGRLICFVRELATELGGNQVGTTGSVQFKPNLINVIAKEASVTVDLRNTDEARLQDAERRLERFLAELAASERLAIQTRRLCRFEPVVFDEGVVRVIEAAAARLGAPVRRMTSGAGQDAQMLARICPAAMIFVPSIDGISHNPAESTRPEHLELGANVLLHTLLDLAE